MYTTRSQASNHSAYNGTGMRGGTPINFGFHAAGFLEGVYSWRTGPRNIADPTGSPPIRQRRQDGWGLITPTNRGSLANRLADRQRYVNDFQRMMIPAETDAGNPHNSRVSTTDTGHPFGTLKVLREPYRGAMDYYESATNWYLGDIWASVSGASTYNASPYTFGFLGNTSSPLSVLASNRQATANRYFAATAPDAKGASVGATLIELLRGDVPSVLKNFRKMMDGHQKVRNYAGSEALNIMFGWTPLINEFANVIKTGMQIERHVYYESFRRKRSWDGPSMRTETSNNQTLSFLLGPWNSSTAPFPGETLGPTGGFGPIYTAQTEMVAREDYHLTSKYTGIAKAGRRANSFSDRAIDVAQQLGLVDDPRLLWDLTPYSWLVDWFTSMGDSISNAQVYAPQSGKYTSDYAYMTTKHVVSIQGNLRKLVPHVYPARFRSLSLQSSSSSLISTAKWRARASPFGFGTQLGSLNASQFAVLVALGFAKTR